MRGLSQRVVRLTRKPYTAIDLFHWGMIFFNQSRHSRKTRKKDHERSFIKRGILSVLWGTLLESFREKVKASVRAAPVLGSQPHVASGRSLNSTPHPSSADRESDDAHLPDL